MPMNKNQNSLNYFKKANLLITGGTGSFGKTVLNRFLKSNIESITVFSRDEMKQEDLRIRTNNTKLKFILGDVRDYDSIDNALKDIDYVFHAAALKQVPSCDFFPIEATRTNIVGTDNVIRASIKNKVKKLILLSTDKAVYPINAMGISKAMAEKVLQSHARQSKKNSTILCTTRYGNVMLSRGSVIPVFIDSIIKNKTINITDLNMTRFLMSLEDSLDLVMYAFKNGKQGDLFVQKAPSCNILTLASALKKIFKSNSKTKVIGMRHGEKLFETLVSKEEMSKAENLGKYFRIPYDNRDLNYSKYEKKGDLKTNLSNDYNSSNVKLLNVEETCKILLKLEYIKELIK